MHRLEKINTIISKILLAVINVYQKAISPLLPSSCRYYPTCSEYGKQAIRWHGPTKGGILTIKRICSCHPLGGHGIDFVPLPMYKFIFKTLSPTDNHQTYNYLNNNVSHETFIVERGVFIDCSSYLAVLNTKMKKN